MKARESLFMWLARRHLLNWMPSRLYLKQMFKKTGYKLNLQNPKGFNEKMQWLKLYDRNPTYIEMVDKVEAKKYVAKRIGHQYVIPTLGVWDRTEDIEFERLPSQFVLKCTHNSGGVVICKDKAELDIEFAKHKLEQSLKRNYFWWGREWPYLKVRPRIIAEEYLEDSERSELTDYKLMCFNGKVKCIFTVTERFSESGLRVTFFDPSWNRLPFERHYLASESEIKKPRNLEKMIQLAEELAESIPFVRVDFYESKDQIFFGELTLYPGSGFEEFNPPEWDEKMGSWLILPTKKRRSILSGGNK